MDIVRRSSKQFAVRPKWLIICDAAADPFRVAVFPANLPTTVAWGDRQGTISSDQMSAVRGVIPEVLTASPKGPLLSSVRLSHFASHSLHHAKPDVAREPAIAWRENKRLLRMSRRRIVVVGGLSWDFISVTERVPDVGESLTSREFSKEPGGKGASSAVAAYRLSHSDPDGEIGAGDAFPEDVRIEVSMIGCIGPDADGELLRQEIGQVGVNVSGIMEAPKGSETGIGIVIVETKAGENRILYNPGANHVLEPADIKQKLGSELPDLLIAQLEPPVHTVELLLDFAGRKGVEVLLNPSPGEHVMPEYLENVSHLIMNQTEAALLCEMKLDALKKQTEAISISDADPQDLDKSGPLAEATDYFHTLHVKNVVITLSSKGAFYSTEYGSHKVKKFVRAEEREANTVKDTTGAGNTFVGAYAVEYLRQRAAGVTEEWDIDLAVRYGCRASARTIERKGSLRPIPWADKVDIPSHISKVDSDFDD